MKRIWIVGFIVFSISPLSLAAKDIDPSGLAQPAFRSLSKDMGSALSYKAIAPAEPLGLLGFDIGLEVSSVHLDNADDWKAAVSDGKKLSTLLLPKLHAHKGLPFGIDIGAFYTSVPTTNIKLMGAEIRYAIISGNVVLPALAVRLALTKLSGVDLLDVSTTSVEITVSKGITLVTPYAGIGYVSVDADPAAAVQPILAKESVDMSKFFIGANLNLGLFNFTFETDKTGDSTTYSLKGGFRF